MRRVLVVEHDRLYRELIREWLEECGVQVIWPPAEGPPPAGIDAVLIDVASRQQAHEYVQPWRRSYPQAAIVAVSGRFCSADGANDAMAARLGVTGVLAKPFTRTDLWTALGLTPLTPEHPALQR